MQVVRELCPRPSPLSFCALPGNEAAKRFVRACVPRRVARGLQQNVEGMLRGPGIWRISRGAACGSLLELVQTVSGWAGPSAVGRH